jgi:ribose transport system ATP-binding protein
MSSSSRGSLVAKVSPETISADEPALLIRGMSKTFDGVQVLHDLILDVQPGEVRALIGENGSGKSTSVKILAGVYSADPGASVEIDGKQLDLGDPGASDRLGLRFVHQDLGLIPNLDARDNLAFAQRFATGPMGTINWRRETRDAQAAMRALGYDIDVTAPVSTLRISERTAIAIARALSPRRGAARVVVLDEPTANLPEHEAERLFGSVRLLKAQGIGVLFISHHLDEVFELADTVTVLRDGRVAADLPVGELTHDGLIELMIGRRLETTHRDFQDPERDKISLDVQSLSGSVAKDLTFQLHHGEVLGIAGITGSGREEIARIIVGDLPRTGGAIALASGATLPSGKPHAAYRAGVVYVPAERKANAVLGEHSVSENVVISAAGRFWKRGLMRRRTERAEVATWLDVLDVRPPEQNRAIESLSGGNQQKAMLARALRLQPSVLVLDEPTQGVDVGAQSQIRQRIRSSVADGLSVLVCSSSGEELVEMCDRIIVLAGGRSVAELSPPFDVDQITAASLRSREEQKQ